MELSDDAYNSESDASDEELESELYSVLHYNSFSGEIPPDLLGKYNITRRDNEFLISLKTDDKSNEDKKLVDIFNENGDVTEPKNGESLLASEKEHVTEESVLFSILPPSSDDGRTSSSIEENTCIVQTQVINEKDTEVVASIETSSSSDDVEFIINASPPKETGHNRSIPTPDKRKKKNKSHALPAEEKSKVVLDRPPVEEVILISDSDSGNDSDVILEEPVFDTFDVSSSSSIECLSDFDSGNMILNTIHKVRTPTSVFPPAEGEEEIIKVKWREVSSPKSWSESMKKYYNKSSKTLKYFDCDKIRKEIKGQGTWDVIDEDLFPRYNRPVKRCSFCRQVDHLVKDCPKRFSNCCVCGFPGHQPSRCPQRMCFNCGSPNAVFVPTCRKCEHHKYKTCDECHQVGHVQSTCPDTWRRYHSTTVGELKVSPPTLNKKLMCPNCGRSGHLYEDCTELYWSSYPPTSFLVKNPVQPVLPGKRKHPSPSEEINDEDNEMGRWSEPNTSRHRKKPRYFDSPILTPDNSRRSFEGTHASLTASPTYSPHFQRNSSFDDRHLFNHNPNSTPRRKNKKLKFKTKFKKNKKRGYRDHNFTI